LFDGGDTLEMPRKQVSCRIGLVDVSKIHTTDSGFAKRVEDVVKHP
jgi:hypothetical protein